MKHINSQIKEGKQLTTLNSIPQKSTFQKDDPLLQRAFNLYQSKEYTLKEIEHHTKIPVSTLKRYLTKYGIKRK